jgi:hypothetical protein
MGAIAGGLLVLPVAMVGVFVGGLGTVVGGHLAGDFGSIVFTWVGFLGFAGAVVCGGAWLGSRISQRVAGRPIAQIASVLAAVVLETFMVWASFHVQF